MTKTLLLLKLNVRFFFNFLFLSLVLFTNTLHPSDSGFTVSHEPKKFDHPLVQILVLYLVWKHAECFFSGTKRISLTGSALNHDTHTHTCSMCFYVFVSTWLHFSSEEHVSLVMIKILFSAIKTHYVQTEYMLQMQ